jgi:hypothetical protein
VSAAAAKAIKDSLTERMAERMGRAPLLVEEALRYAIWIAFCGAVSSHLLGPRGFFTE